MQRGNIAFAEMSNEDIELVKACWPNPVADGGQIVGPRKFSKISHERMSHLSMVYDNYR